MTLTPGGDPTRQGLSTTAIPMSKEQRRPKASHVIDDSNLTPAAALRIDQIVSAAAKLFDKVGYHNANMEMLAEATGLQKPSLYHYVKSKGEVLLRIHHKLLDTLNAQHLRRVE